MRDYTENYETFLKRIAPYVILCGSFARETETDSSDLDFFVRQKPQNPEEELQVDTTYLPDIMAIAEEMDYDIDSCVVGSITLSAETTGVRQLEFSYLYKLPSVNPIGVRFYRGIPFLTCEDDKEADYDLCFDSLDDYGNVVNPLPSYTNEIELFRERGLV